MTKTWVLVLSSCCGLLIIAACNAVNEPVISTPDLIVTSENKILPTPVSPGQMVVYDGLQMVMSEAEITESYQTEYGTNREPPAGKRIIWIHIQLKNSSQGEINLPVSEHFSVLNGTTEFKATYGHRKEYLDYMALNATMVQRQELDAWLRFDIPAALELKDLLFAFLPESSQVSFGFSTSDYPWGDHPIYLWNCAP